MLLTILIPTYNRANDLNYNLSLLEKYITGNALCNDVKVLISSNHSTDNTASIVNDYISKNTFQINFFEQTSNIGLEKNALFVLGKADTDYVMFLGDDDYIQEGYLLRIITELKNNPSLGCILPSNKAIRPDKTEIPDSGRDLNIPTTYYKAGFDACLANAWRGHSISGIVIIRSNVYEIYIKKRIHNLYPFIFFVSYSALSHDVLVITEFPMLITSVPQTAKDWNYGSNGLLVDMFNNFRYLDISSKQRGLLERSLILRNEWRYLNYVNQRIIDKAIETVVFSRNTSWNGKVFITEHTISNNQYKGRKLKLLINVLHFLLNIKHHLKL